MKNILFAFLALIIVSCGSNKNKAEIVTLDGEYQMLTLQGKDVATEDFSLTFTPIEHRVTGETGCNGFSAKYTQENNVLSIGRAMSTRMYCEGKMKTEQKIISSLEDVAKVGKRGQEIVLYSTDNTVLFTLNEK